MGESKESKKPFHESIVDFINQVECPATLNEIGQLLTITKVPKNHDAIARALGDKFLELTGRDSRILQELASSLGEEGAQEAAKQQASAEAASGDSR